MKLTAAGLDCYLGDHQILYDVSLAALDGGITALLGPNGSGKTTLLRVLAGLLRAKRGTVHVGDPPTAVDKLPGRRRAQLLALVEQNATTGLELTVAQVIELGRIPHRGRWPSARLEGIDSIARGAELAGVTHLLHRTWGSLSGGEQQRTQLARSIAQEPSILLLDEPTNHLDLGHQIDFLERVRGLGITTVAALHDMELAAAFCDRAVMLGQGRVVAAGPVPEVVTPPLLDEWYRVDADVVDHPHHPRPHLIWNGVTRRDSL